MESFIFTIYFILTIPFVLLGNGALWVLGYEVTNDAQKVAERIAKNGDDPAACFDIRFFSNVFGLAVANVQSSCVYEYASLTRDPSACELLMPSEYGWSCLGAATNNQPCLFDFKEPPEVRGNGLMVPMSECANGDVATRNNACCAIARTVFYDDNGDCSSFASTQEFIDQCYFEMGKKRIDMDMCLKIKNENIRSACAIGVHALTKKTTSH